MLNRYEKGLREVNFISENESTLSVGYPCSPYWMNMPEFIQHFKNHHCVDIQIQIGAKSNDTVASFLKGEIDVVFSNILRIQNTSDCKCIPVITIGFHVVMVPGHHLAKANSLTPSELYPYEVFCANGTPGDSVMAQLNHVIRTCGIDPERMHIVPHREDVLSAVATGRDIGLTPADTPFGEGGNLITVPIHAPQVSIQYACAIHNDASPLARMFMKEAIAFLKKNA